MYNEEKGSKLIWQTDEQIDGRVAALLKKTKQIYNVICF